MSFKPVLSFGYSHVASNAWLLTHIWLPNGIWFQDEVHRTVHGKSDFEAQNGLDQSHPPNLNTSTCQNESRIITNDFSRIS